MESIFYRDGFKYVLDEDYIDTIPIFPPETIVTKWVCLSPKGKLFLRSGFGFDGPSGPTIDTRSAMRGAAKHDGIHRLLRLGLLEEKWRKVADEMYMTDCIADSKKTRPKWIPAAIYEPRAELRFKGHFAVLRAVGWTAAKVGTEPLVLRAP